MVGQIEFDFRLEWIAARMAPTRPFCGGCHGPFASGAPDTPPDHRARSGGLAWLTNQMTWSQMTPMVLRLVVAAGRRGAGSGVSALVKAGREGFSVPGRRSGVVRRTIMVRIACDGEHYVVALRW